MAQLWKQAILWGMIALSAMGVIIAFSNLPVLTGCGFYGRCALIRSH